MLLTWNNEDRDDVAHPLMCQVVAIHRHCLSVGYHVAVPCFWCEKKRGGRGVMVLTCMNVESNNDRHRHRLDDIAWTLTYHAIFNICHGNGCCCCGMQVGGGQMMVVGGGGCGQWW